MTVSYGLRYLEVVTGRTLSFASPARLVTGGSLRRTRRHSGAPCHLPAGKVLGALMMFYALKLMLDTII
jgi:hypothetical protein